MPLKNVQEFNKLLGKEIRHRRIDKKITSTDLGKAIGLSKNSICNIEAGRQNLSAYQIYLINKIIDLGINIDFSYSYDKSKDEQQKIKDFLNK